MGTGTFTRNRAWYQTVIWDEYALRHAYLTLIPTFTFAIPLYWYGAFLNRDLEQNFAATMYAMDYENRRNRLTHNMIMENFELHVDKVKDMLDEVRKEGFEKVFEYELKNPTTEIPKDREVVWNEEMLAELDEYSGLTGTIDEIVETQDLTHWQRTGLESMVRRRKNPKTPYKYLNSAGLYSDKVEHANVDP